MTAHLRKLIVAAMLACGSAGPAAGQGPPAPGALRLAKIFQDGMVLQRGVRIPVWGWAPPGSTVSATLAGRSARARADAAGAWSLGFPAMPAGGPHELTVQSGGERLALRDALVGDVWIASGQSNMAWPITRTNTGPAVIRAARDSMLREFAVPLGWSETPETDLAGGSWAPADSAHVGRFSAVAYFFARRLRAEQGIPIGIIHSSWGGSNVETWLSRAAHGLGDSAWSAVVRKERETQRAIVDSLRAAGAPVPAEPSAQRINKIPAYLYNRMIHPLLGYPIRGVIWYQGESNAGNPTRAAAYGPLFTKLIQSWRAEWRGSARDFPFLWVQLPNYGAVDTVPPALSNWATLRESQASALALPRTGQAVIIEHGTAGDIHPRDKEPVGERLALVARKVAYGEAVEASGPTYRRHSVRDGRAIVEFDHLAGGLVSSAPGGALREFAVAGADRRWVWAQARIEGDRVIVWSPDVPEPVAVRYAWSNSPRDPSLYNGVGLPAAPFRTDRW